eukprot:2275068-Pleurochrysis_carterae.AAC.1
MGGASAAMVRQQSASPTPAPAPAEGTRAQPLTAEEMTLATRLKLPAAPGGAGGRADLQLLVLAAGAERAREGCADVRSACSRWRKWTGEGAEVPAGEARLAAGGDTGTAAGGAGGAGISGVAAPPAGRVRSEPAGDGGGAWMAHGRAGGGDTNGGRGARAARVGGAAVGGRRHPRREPGRGASAAAGSPGNGGCGSHDRVCHGRQRRRRRRGGYPFDAAERGA